MPPGAVGLRQEAGGDVATPGPLPPGDCDFITKETPGTESREVVPSLGLVCPSAWAGLSRGNRQSRAPCLTSAKVHLVFLRRLQALLTTGSRLMELPVSKGGICHTRREEGENSEVSSAPSAWCFVTT